MARLSCSGSGYKGDGFRYWLSARELLLWPGNRASYEEQEAWRNRCAAHYQALRDQQAAQLKNLPQAEHLLEARARRGYDG